jgi:hypothetical protein
MRPARRSAVLERRSVRFDWRRAAEQRDEFAALQPVKLHLIPLGFEDRARPILMLPHFIGWVRDWLATGWSRAACAEAAQKNLADRISEHEQNSMTMAKRSTLMADVNRKLVDAHRWSSKVCLTQHALWDGPSNNPDQSGGRDRCGDELSHGGLPFASGM